MPPKTKRQSMKGKGTDIFLPSGEEPQAPPTPAAPTQDEPNGRGTYYLPPSLLQRLEYVYLELRGNNRKVQKSEIVRICLETVLSEYEEKQEDSTLSQSLNAKALKQ